MSDIIQLLPDHVANQIAAGEVIQRPSSVVKELLENAIDAGATDIKLLVKDAGKTLIQVIDNGKGMSTTDARMCFERHATSKIKNAQDLFDLHTKGFRGEALASIAAIAHVVLKTKPEGEELGNQIKIEGSKIISQDFVSSAVGTSIAVKNLFYNLPARRNFLKSDAIETRHMVDQFQRVALAHPEIAFSLHHNSNELYHLKAENLRKRIIAIFGSKMNEKLVPINEQTAILTMTGFITKHEYAKKKRGEQFFFVNHRFIKSAYLNHAVVAAFDGLLEQGAYPSYFLYLTVPPHSVDINIHPTKTEVKFDNEKDLYAIIKAAVKHSLGQYNIAPVLDFNKDPNLDTPYHYNKKETSSVPKITVDPNFNPFEKQEGKRIPIPQKREQDWEVLYSDLEPDTSRIPKELFEVDTQKETGKTFQIQKKYILSSIKSGIVLIHQSQAHQRILYEEFLKTITIKEVNSQQLLFPVNIPFATADMEMLQTIKPDLESAGFVFTEFTKESITVTGIPVSVTDSQAALVIEQLLEDVKSEIPNTGFNPFDVMAKSFAKTLAVKTGTYLSEKEQETLVYDLFLCKEPAISPTGKATFKTLTLHELDSLFTN